jgi:hypothetical protein
VNHDDQCSRHPHPLPGIRLPAPMRLALDEAIKGAAISKCCSTFGCPNLSKLRPCFKLKSDVAACSFPSGLYSCLVCLHKYLRMPSMIGAAPPLPALISLNPLARTLAFMPSFTDRASKLQQNSVGGGERQLTTLAAAPPQVVLEPVVVVPTDIERNRQAIAPPPLASHLQTKRNREQA